MKLLVGEAEVIGTRRLELLPLAVQHANEMAQALADPALHEFIGGTPATAAGLRARYARLLAGSPDPSVCWRNWVVRQRAAGCLVGHVQATVSRSDSGLLAEIAWVVGTPWQRRGIATEAAAGMVGWLATRSVRTLIAHIHPSHPASAKVAAALGLTPTEEYLDGERTWRHAARPR